MSNGLYVCTDCEGICEQNKKHRCPSKLLADFSDSELLDELARRSVIHKSRLQLDHVIVIKNGHYHMTHPLSCDLSNCEHDHLASELAVFPPETVFPVTDGKYKLIKDERSFKFDFLERV